jgi:hypothetical protein
MECVAHAGDNDQFSPRSLAQSVRETETPWDNRIGTTVDYNYRAPHCLQKGSS